jgi:hypothetical protein
MQYQKLETASLFSVILRNERTPKVRLPFFGTRKTTDSGDCYNSVLGDMASIITPGAYQPKKKWQIPSVPIGSSAK